MSEPEETPVQVPPATPEIEPEPEPEDEYQVLGDLLAEDTLHLDPLYRLRGLILFFSISLGALGLGASLAYFTRESSARPLPRAPRRPGPPELRVSRPPPLPPRPAPAPPPVPASRPAPTSAPEAATRTASRQLSVPTDPVIEAIAHATRPDRSDEGDLEGDLEAPPDLAPFGPAAPDSPEEASEADPAPAPSPAPGEAATLLDQSLRAPVGAVLEALSRSLDERYGLPLPLDLEAPEATMERELPAWVNLRYLERLARRALDRVPGAGLELTTERGAFGAGSLALTTPEGPAPGFRLRLVKPSARSRVALIVDDVGYGGPSTRSLLDLRAPFSVAILPFYPGSSWAARTTLERGLESMLHFPMQPKGAEGKYRKSVVVGAHLEAEEIRRRARRAIQSLPGITGLNNHMGSLATESWYVMGEVLPLIRERGLFFVDSVTSSRSIAYQSARKLGIPATRRDADFLDNDPSYAGVAAAFEHLLASCKPGVERVAILHDKPDSVRAMEAAIPRFRDRGVELVFAGEMVH